MYWTRRIIRHSPQIVPSISRGVLEQLLELVPKAGEQTHEPDFCSLWSQNQGMFAIIFPRLSTMKEVQKQLSRSAPQIRKGQLPAIDASHIHLLICGGTIDNIDLDTGARNEVSGIESYLKAYVRPYFGLSRELLFMKDSREITEADRTSIARAIAESPYKRFLVTHGTYTMAETGRYLKKHIDPSLGKLVVLVGSMIPLGEVNSDAPFNLGFASATAMILRKIGVVIAFNGKIWDPDDVKKNIEELRFEKT